jgi:hypothetical protein
MDTGLHVQLLETEQYDEEQSTADSMSKLIKSALKFSWHDLPPVILSICFILGGVGAALACFFAMSASDVVDAQNALVDRTNVGVYQLKLAQGLFVIVPSNL